MFATPSFANQVMKAQISEDYHAKQGRSTGRWVLPNDVGARGVYLKRHYRLPWWQRLLALVWPGRGWSPAMAEWRHLLWARSQGITAPSPVAAGEFIGPGLRLESFLVIEELTGMLPLHQAVPLAQHQLSPPAFALWKHSVIKEMARLCRTLHQAQRYHKDLYLCHFFVPRAKVGSAGPHCGPVYLIDFHRLGHHPWTGWRWRIKDLAQLLYSSDLLGVTDRDRLRFFCAYRRPHKQNWTSRCLLRLIRWKAARYHRQNRN